MDENQVDEAEAIFLYVLQQKPESQWARDRYAQALLLKRDYLRIIDMVRMEIHQACDDNRKTVAFLGNCQSTPLRDICARHVPFKERFAPIRSLPLIHTMPAELQQLVRQKLIPAIDLLVTQNLLHKNYPLRTAALLPEARDLVVFPTCFFNGYHPDAMFLKDKQGKTLQRTMLGGLHSAFVFQCFTTRKKAEDCARELSAGSWLGRRIEHFVAQGFEELRKRERYWDIKLTDFFQERYKEGMLFHIVNHPEGGILHHFADQLMARLELAPLDEKIRLQTKRIMAESEWIFPAPVARMLGVLESCSRDSFQVRNKIYSPLEYVESHYKYYADNPEIVSHNHAAVQKRMRMLTGGSSLSFVSKSFRRLFSHWN